MKKILTFKINNELYCFDVMKVVSIDKKSHVTEVPLSPPSVLGVINLRGQIVSLIDLRRLFKIEADESIKDQCNLIIETDHGLFGCVVDSVCDVVELNVNQIEYGEDQLVQIQSKNYIDKVLKFKEQIIFELNPTVLYQNLLVENEENENHTVKNKNNENNEKKVA